MEFDASLPNPVSMAQITGHGFNRAEVLERVVEHLNMRYAQLREGDAEALQEEYCRRLYRLNEEHWFALPDGSRFRGTIRGVEASGALVVEAKEGKVDSYRFKEIEFVLKN